MVNDTRQIEVLVAHAVPDLVSNLLVIIGVAVMLFVIHPTLALITMIPVPFVVLLGTLFSKKVAPLFRINQEVLGELNGVLQDNLSGIQEIQSFCQERQEHEKMERRCKYYSKVNIRANFANAFFHPGVEFVTSLGTAIVIGFGGFLALDGRMNTADIVGFFMYLSLFYSPLATLSRMVEDVQMAYAGAVRVFDLLDSVPEIQDTPASQPVSRIQGAVEFRNVSFSYLPQEPILQDLSFSVQPGQMVAIVGPTGVGKTTVLSLLERFYDPQKGSILLDGKDIRSFTVQSLRNQISMVQQDVFLFHGTIGENIAYGTPGAAPEEIRQAAKIARADDFISQMPDGYDTQVGERGVRLSGGQKQRLAIARAVLRDTPILILDEATSAVDTETEREIQQAIDQLTGSRTIFVIAHRLSTVKKADQILVLAEGKLAEQGTHQQLLEKGGIYASLCGVQQLRDECFDPNKALV